LERYNPDLWDDEFAYLSKPGIAEIQVALFYDYQSNLVAYPAWQDYLRTHKPPMLVIWGKYDPAFALPEIDAYKRDVPGTEVHVLEAGHFAMDEAVDDVAALMRAFMAKTLQTKPPISTQPASKQSMSKQPG
jgi:pimeloyl-ACP methyl ester carboxylesterase